MRRRRANLGPVSPSAKPSPAKSRPAKSGPAKSGTSKSSISPGRQKMAVARPDDHVIVLFGATGDLARRKLLPGLFHLAKAGLMPANYRVIGSSPTPFAASDHDFPQNPHDGVSAA